MKTLFLIFIHSSIICGLKEVERRCPREAECMPSSKCPSYQTKISQIKSIRTNNAKRRSLIAELKRTVCNKELKAVCCKMSTECGQSQLPPASIVGGNKTLEGEFPFSVLLGYRSKVYRGTLPGGRKVYRDEDTWICSGVILNSRFILTAAHCKISNQRKYRVRVGVHRVDGYIGSYDSGHSGEDGNIQDFTINDDNFLAHPQYVRRRRSRGQLEVRNDIGLIKLPSDVEFSLRSQPACWRHSSSVSDGHGQCAVVVGWGKTDPDQISRLGGVFSSDQIKLTLPLVPLQACQQHYPGVDSGQLCAGGVKGQDSCGGDSGGGLFSTMEDGSWQVIGIVSYGSRACGDGIPGIYTNVSYYKDWIKDNMENL